MQVLLSRVTVQSPIREGKAGARSFLLGRTLGIETQDSIDIFCNLVRQEKNNIFVGRERELKELQEAWATACAGRGQVFLLGGEPGIGKTRLTEEFAALVRQHDSLILWGRCWEGDGAPAFWPWIQIVRTYLQHHPSDTVAAEMGAGASDMAQVVAEIHSKVPTLAPPPLLSPEDSRFRFFDSMTMWLKRAAVRCPLLLVFDDLHWADTSSLLLLEFLAREVIDTRVLILGTYRDTEVRRTHPLSETLGGLARSSHRLILSGLSRDEATHFIENTTGVTPTTNLVAAMHERTEGNPFFLHEILRLLAAEGGLANQSKDTAALVRIPTGIRETLQRRLGQVSISCHKLLSTASVIGREFSVALLALVTKEETQERRDQLLGLLQEALDVSIITSAPNDPDRYRFTHVLVCEALYEDLSLREHTRLHRRVGEAMEQLYAAYLGPHVVELAEHFFKAVQGGMRDKAIHYARQAAEQATTLLAYEEAATYYTRASHVLEFTETNEQQRCELLLALGEVQSHAGDTARARETFLQAAAIARKLHTRGDSSQAVAFLARAAVGFGKVWFVTGTGMVDEQLVRLLEEARTAFTGSDSPLRARVLARLAAELRWSAPREQRAALSQQAVDMARRLGDESTLTYTLSAWHWALWGADNVGERLAVTTEMVTLAEKGRDKTLALIGHTWRSLALLERGERDQSDTEVAALTHLADELRQPFYQWWAIGQQVLRAVLEGRLDEAELLSQQQLLVGQQVQAPDALAAFGVQMAIVRNEQGRLQELEVAFKEFVQMYPTVPAWRCGLAGLYRELERASEAREEFERVAAQDFTDLPQDQQWLTALVLLTDVCVFLNDMQRAVLLYDLLLPYASHVAIIGPGAACYGSVARSLGLLAATLSRWDEAEQFFMTALAINARLRAKPFLARTQYEYAQMLSTRGWAGDVQRAEELLAQASVTAQELGLAQRLARVEALQKVVVSSQQSVASSQDEVVSIQYSVVSSLPPPTQSSVLSPQSSLLPTPNIFRQQEDFWTIGYDGLTAQLPAAKGLYHLAALLREPGREFHVFDLLAMTDFQPSETVPRQVPDIHLFSKRRRGASSEGRAFLDQQAKTAYQQRLDDLRSELEEAERNNDPLRMDNARAEIDFITKELVAAYGGDVHARQRDRDLEKARKTVANRLRTALSKLRHVHPALWRHLRVALKTGTFCSYNPERPTSWQV